MKQKVFESLHNERWEKIETFLSNEDQPRFRFRKRANDNEREKAVAHLQNTFRTELPDEYRRLCHDYAIARTRNYSPSLIARLDALVKPMHHRLYRQRSRYRYQGLRFFVFDFPDALKANAVFVWFAIALFLLPAILMGLLSYFNEDLLYALMPWEQVREFEFMYDPDNDVVGRKRSSDTDLMMFGYYIYNNIGISFRTFAGGLLFGVGSLFFLVYNGLFMGGISGHIVRIGYEETFFTFVVGHAALELTAIALSGAAGMKLGFALLVPGKLSRLGALKHAARDAIKIMYGVGIMLLLAAFVEAFWSSSELSPAIKYTVGAVMWLLVIGYCLSGRASRGNPDEC